MGDLNENQRSQTVNLVGHDEVNSLHITNEGRAKTESKFAKDDTTTDATGVLKTNGLQQIFGHYFENSLHPLRFNTLVANGGAITLNPQIAAAVLSTNTTNGSRVVYATKKYVPHIIGKSHFITIACAPTAGISGVTKRWGLLSDNNGLFFAQEDGILKFVVRDDSSGSVVDDKISQSSWNLDKLDGTGPSGFNLNVDNVAVFVIEYCCHGDNLIRFGVQCNKNIIWAHEIMSENQFAHPKLRNPTLSIAFEVINTTATASASSFRLYTVSAEVSSNSSIVPASMNSISVGGLGRLIQSNSYLPLLSVRPKLLFDGIRNWAIIEPKQFQFLNIASPMHIKLMMNGTLTGASWTSVNPFSACEYDVSANTLTGGLSVFECYIAQGADGMFGLSPNMVNQLWSNFVIGLNIEGTVGDILTITARSLTNSSTAYASAFWGETK